MFHKILKSNNKGRRKLKTTTKKDTKFCFVKGEREKKQILGNKTPKSKINNKTKILKN